MIVEQHESGNFEMDQEMVSNIPVTESVIDGIKYFNTCLPLKQGEEIKLRLTGKYFMEIFDPDDYTRFYEIFSSDALVAGRYNNGNDILYTNTAESTEIKVSTGNDLAFVDYVSGASEVLFATNVPQATTYTTDFKELTVGVKASKDCYLAIYERGAGIYYGTLNGLNDTDRFWNAFSSVAIESWNYIVDDVVYTVQPLLQSAIQYAQDTMQKLLQNFIDRLIQGLVVFMLVKATLRGQNMVNYYLDNARRYYHRLDNVHLQQIEF